MMRATITSEERFFAKVALPGSDGCLNWIASRDPAGYGKFGRSGRKAGWVAAHRWAYAYWVAPIPKDLTVDHLCRNKSCVNPDHMEIVSRGENAARVKRGLHQEFCRRGHRQTGDALYVFKSHQQCRTCKLATAKRRYAERKAAA